MRLTTDKEAVQYFAAAQTWIATKAIFRDAKFVATSAVAEYIANQNGHTLYPSEDTNERIPARR